MFDFVFRFDANEHIGAGHFQRALALIQILRSRGYSLACCGDYADDYQHRLSQLQLPFYAAGASLQARCLVFDHYGDFDISSIGIKFERSVVFEDLATRGHSKVDLVINAFGNADDLKQRYPAAKVLCGVEFLLFRERVNALVHQGFDAPREKKRKTVLVSLGGTDQSGILLRVIRTLCELLDPEVQIKVLSVVDLKVPERCILQVGFVEDFLEQALASDLIICGLGQSFLEMQALGKASIGLLLAENQRPCAECLAAYRLNIIAHLATLEMQLAACLRSEFSVLLAAKSQAGGSHALKDKKMADEIIASQGSPLKSRLSAKKDDLIERMVALLV